MYTKPHVSTFEGGLNTDVSHHRMAPNMYSDALNIRILTDSGLSSGAIVNEIGNELLFKLPTTVEPVFVYAIGTVTGESGTAEYYLGADPATGTQTTVTGVPDDTAQRAYDYLMADAGVQADIAAGKYVIYFNRKEIVIHNLD